MLLSQVGIKKMGPNPLMFILKYGDDILGD